MTNVPQDFAKQGTLAPSRHTTVAPFNNLGSEQRIGVLLCMRMSKCQKNVKKNVKCQMYVYSGMHLATPS